MALKRNVERKKYMKKVDKKIQQKEKKDFISSPSLFAKKGNEEITGLAGSPRNAACLPLVGGWKREYLYPSREKGTHKALFYFSFFSSGCVGGGGRGRFV